MDAVRASAVAFVNRVNLSYFDLAARRIAVSCGQLIVYLVVWSIVWIGASSTGSAQHADPAAVARVRSGELAEAHASWWGFDKDDATPFLQAALDSGARRVVVDDLGMPWIVRTIRVPSNVEVVFEQGVIVAAKRGEFRGTGDCLFRIDGQDRVKLIGNGATLRMHRDDYDKPPYKKAEWRHVLSINSSTNIDVRGLTLAESGGDGIYLGVSKAGVTNKNIRIKDVICDRNYRQGISVISAEDLLIEDTVMRDTDGTAPRAGIDFEPNHESERLVNCVMRNCIVENNAGVGFAFYLPNLTAKSAPISIQLENCTARGTNRASFALTLARGSSATGSIDLMRCTLAGGNGPAITVRNKPVTGCRIRFADCMIRRPAAENPELPAILLQAGPGQTVDMGGIAFDRCQLIEIGARPIMRFQDRSGECGLSDVTGSLTVVRKQSERPLEIKITPAWLESARIGKRYRRFPPYPMHDHAFAPVRLYGAPRRMALTPFSLRHGGTFVLYARQQETVAFTLKYFPVGRYAATPLKVVCTAPSGKKQVLPGVPFQQQGELSFHATETGLYRVTCDCGANRVQLTASTHPASILDDGHGIHFISSTGDLFFYVPTGTKTFAVKIMGEGQEAIAATLLDPAGHDAWHQAEITMPEQFVANPAAEQTGRVWRIHLSRPAKLPMEDYTIWLQGIPPLVSSNSDMLLKPVE